MKTRKKGVPYPIVESKYDCAYFGKINECLSANALKKHNPCKKCAIIDECKEEQSKDYPIIKATQGMIVTCYREQELELIQAMIEINRYIEKKLKKIPACDVQIGLYDSIKYKKSRDEDEESIF